MAINEEILQQPWEGKTKLSIEEGLKVILQGILNELTSGIADGSIGMQQLTTAIQTAINNAVPNTRKVNGKALSGDITLNASDVGAMPAGSAPDLSGYYTSQQVEARIAALVNSAPDTLDTLKELADALGNDDDFATSMANALAGKVSTSDIANALNVTAAGKVLDARQGKALNDLITALQSSKANDADVVKSISVNGGTAQTPTNGTVNLTVEGAEGKSAYQSYVDTTEDDPVKTEAEWVASLRGTDGATSNDDIVVVHDYDGEPDDLESGKVAVLGADMGESIGNILNNCYRSSAAGGTSYVLTDVDVELTAGTGDGTVGAALVLGQRRQGVKNSGETGGVGYTNTADGANNSRATIDTYYLRTGVADTNIQGYPEPTPIPFPDVFRVVLPTGFSVGFIGTNTRVNIGSNEGVEETGWLENGATVDLSQSANKKYITVNFRYGNGAAYTMDATRLATLAAGFKLVYTEQQTVETTGASAGKAMEFVNADGSVAKTVYAKEDNGNNVQVYTKTAVDAKIAAAAGDAAVVEGIDRSPVAVATVHGLRHPIGYEGGSSNSLYGINTIKTGSDFIARATSAHYYKISGYDLIDQSLVDGGSTEAEATIMGAIKDGVIRLALPNGIKCLFQHSQKAGRASSGEYYSNAQWRTPSNGIVDYDLDEGDAIDYTDYPYIAINFCKSDGTNFTDETAAAIGDDTYIIPLGPITSNGKNDVISIEGTSGTELYILSHQEGHVSIPTVGKVEQMMSQYQLSGIIGRNKEAIDRIWAARKHFDMESSHYGSYTVYNHENNFCIAHGSDFHVDVDRLENFRDFVDGVASIDAAIITGDFTSNGNDAELTAMMGVEFERVQPMRCIGNHERDGGKTLAQIAEALDMDNDYYVNDDYVTNYGIRFIILNRYDTTATDKATAQKDGHWSQTQIDWFVTKLDEAITNGYHVIVAMHAVDAYHGLQDGRTAENNKGFWQRYVQVPINPNTQINGKLVEDIIAAFRSGGTVSGTYTHADNTASVSINHTFSASGKFIAYMVGHAHFDEIGYSRTHEDQLYLVSPTSGCIGLDQSSNEYAVGTQVLDLPRKEGTKTEDCFNVYGIDTVNKVVKVVRVGADMNDLMEKREAACFEYEPTINS